eukprot:1158147-Pelagomonas_calceolata.AAC.2
MQDIRMVSVWYHSLLKANSMLPRAYSIYAQGYELHLVIIAHSHARGTHIEPVSTVTIQGPQQASTHIHSHTCELTHTVCDIHTQDPASMHTPSSSCSTASTNAGRSCLGMSTP